MAHLWQPGPAVAKDNPPCDSANLGEGAARMATLVKVQCLIKEGKLAGRMV